jgi:uncharacterized membrane protein YccC
MAGTYAPPGSVLGRVLPALFYGIRLWAAVCLALFVAFRLELDDPYWAGATAAVVSQPVLGAPGNGSFQRMERRNACC